MIAKRFRIVGRVQGVFFRRSTCIQAQKLGLVGWVKNSQDGGVQAYACGDIEAMRQFESWLDKGPPQSVVTEVSASDATVEELSDFFVC